MILVEGGTIVAKGLAARFTGEGGFLAAVATIRSGITVYRLRVFRAKDCTDNKRLVG